MQDKQFTEPEEEPIDINADEEPLEIEADEEPVAVKSDSDVDEEPISLVETLEEDTSGASKRKLGGEGITHADKKLDFKRPVNVTKQGATRCRLFHSKVALSSLQFMENQINEWVDGDEIDIKHVGHVIGIMEGKIPEPNFIVMVWY